MGKYRKVEKVNYWKGMTFAEKIDYFFQYYFWKVVILLIVAALIGAGIYQVATNYKPDYEVMFISEKLFLDDELNAMEDYFNSIAIDNNDDGHEVAGFASIVFFTESEADMSQYNANLQQKLVIQLSTGQPSILICSKEELKYLTESGLMLVPLPENTSGASDAYEAVELKYTTLNIAPALEKVPDDYLVCMIEMQEKHNKKENMVSKRDYTYTVFTSMLTVEK